MKRLLERSSAGLLGVYLQEIRKKPFPTPMYNGGSMLTGILCHSHVLLVCCVVLFWLDSFDSLLFVTSCPEGSVEPCGGLQFLNKACAQHLNMLTLKAVLQKSTPVSCCSWITLKLISGNECCKQLSHAQVLFLDFAKVLTWGYRVLTVYKKYFFTKVCHWDLEYPTSYKKVL